ncbi:hypothetical protein J2W56_001009 [Nocardia kruczakiae]|uniref:Uncharacterized protein n=1 Tax=Nocardia kruczakiae TaxID=261477 RepID=A0ABU1XB34_9NOCA|nr:hypothetical protein [Nocardia kruczakiae]MDR7167291.1 hypothetical protein [Nocardia kruczakiae]
MAASQRAAENRDRDDLTGQLSALLGERVCAVAIPRHGGTFDVEQAATHVVAAGYSAEEWQSGSFSPSIQ